MKLKEIKRLNQRIYELNTEINRMESYTNICFYEKSKWR